MLKEDHWLGDFLGKKAYALNVTENMASHADELKDIFSGKVFVYTKINSVDLKSSSFLESLGFRLVDTNVSFERQISRGSNKKTESSPFVRAAEPADKELVMQLAGRNFIYSRFHLDPSFPDVIANTIKAEWAANYFKGKRGDELLVAQFDDKIAGFVQLLYREKTAVIDLIASDSAFRRRGVSSALIDAISEFNKDVEKIEVGTQVANIPSMRLYEKNGFRITGSTYVFHYHG